MPLSEANLRRRLRGVAAGLLTPFDDELRVVHHKLAENARTLSEEGIETFLAAANISEYHSLSHRERIEVTETSVDAVPSDACVLAGVGGSTANARELIEAYDRIGVDGMMIMPPDHSYVHERGLIRYYEKLDEVTDTPLVPYVKGFDPSVAYLRDLTRVDGVVGIKYALKDPVKLGAGVEAGADDVVWVDGLAEPYAVAFWNEGIEGFSAGVSNFRPEVGLALYDALEAEDWERARKIRNIALPFQNFRDSTGEDNEIPGAISVSAVKKGLELAGLHGGPVREPIRSLSPEDERRAEQLYANLDDDIERVLD
ncbi:dihydrodipicolinate synthase family protein [Halopelagius longus]|uniref:4-hydroxy-tetrahydrodipicolinate synthase n=1 Tax=Halopelagius longus TaxID=1236180 RepID=A0A1H1G110_9EURY|nr:dihydrodipicolinate synthase family protein [Halopelagius longus]RDI69907.1 dihydrodipicolinate synthase family protein [Halopelagius longus]SDR06902.1 4-hydroxy-tetrahydrodipicolinate synthase [Halopelagius longus]